MEIPLVVTYHEYRVETRYMSAKSDAAQKINANTFLLQAYQELYLYAIQLYSYGSRHCVYLFKIILRNISYAVQIRDAYNSFE